MGRKLYPRCLQEYCGIQQLATELAWLFCPRSSPVFMASVLFHLQHSLLCGLVLAAAPCFSAQAQLDLRPDRDPSRDLNTQVIPGSTPGQDLITGGSRPAISPDQPGPNLFHSFESFNIPADRSVYFETQPGIETIFSRVTGGDVSDILGTLGVQSPLVNLYFLNPNGIVFGETAQIDIKGAFFAAVADGFGFEAGSSFSAVQPSSPLPLLSVNVQPGLQFGQTPRSLIATNLSKAGGPLTLGASGAIAFDRYQGAALTVIAGGDVAVRAIDTRNPSGSGDVWLEAQGDINLNNYGAIRTNARPNARGAAGNVTLLAAGDITLAERFLIQTRAYGDGAGGDITVRGNSLTLNNRTQLDSSTRGTANGGNIDIEVANGLVLRGTDTRILSLVEPGRSQTAAISRLRQVPSPLPMARVSITGSEVRGMRARLILRWWGVRCSMVAGLDRRVRL